MNTLIYVSTVYVSLHTEQEGWWSTANCCWMYCTLRRLIAKAARRRVKEKVVALTSPLQLVFCVHLGAEAAVYAVTRYLQDIGKGQALLKLDFSNAFNSISWNELLRVTYQNCSDT